MILEWPLTDSNEVAQVLRPGTDMRPDSALRALREKGLAADAITVVPRTSRGANGKAVWYSSLMLDVARLVRRGQTETARRVHQESRRLADHRAAHFVAKSLVEYGDTDPDPETLDRATGGALSRLALLTATVRQNHSHELGVTTFVKQPDGTESQGACTLGDAEVTLARLYVEATTTAENASPESVNVEKLAGHTVMFWYRRAFNSPADPNDRVPSEPTLLSATDRAQLGEPRSTMS